MDEKPGELIVILDELVRDSDADSNSGDSRWLLSGNKDDRTMEEAAGKQAAPAERVVSLVQLAIATFFSLMWNIAGVLITIHFCRISGKDKTRLLAVALTAVPILVMGSLLMWFVLCEWCNQVMIVRRRAWNAPAVNGEVP